MTPLGKKLRELRAARGVSQKDMAKALGVSAAYLSALEHGHRAAPNWALLQKMIGFFNIIWDDAEELVRLAEASHPRVVIDTSGLTPEATEAANLLAEVFGNLDTGEIQELKRIAAGAAERGREKVQSDDELRTAPAIQRAGR
jgi:transcriptional regulator with XRE-family HTH domain